MRLVRKLGLVAGLLVAAVSNVAFAHSADKQATARAVDSSDQAAALTDAEMSKFVAGKGSCGGSGSDGGSHHRH